MDFRIAEMTKRCCRNCVYATRVQGRWHRVMMGKFPGLRLCFNGFETPGQMQEVYVGSVCENFRQRTWPVGWREATPEPPSDEIRYIPLTRGLYATVDAQDYPELIKYKWHARIRQGTNLIYAARNTSYREKGQRRKGMVLMHRQIMKTPEGMVVDHINGNGINNRRCNMRNCSQFENTHNCRPRKDGKSKFIGVDPHRNRWRARVCYKGRKQHIGVFDTQVEAARARDRKAIELFGAFARLNFPQEGRGA